MDWADDVAYAVHDVEDFFRAGLIPLDRLATDEAERERFLTAEFLRNRIADEGRHEELRRIFVELVAPGPIARPYEGSRLDRAALRSFTSSLINRYVNAVSLRDGEFGEAALVIEEQRRTEVMLLKGLTWHYVINSASLVTQRFGQRSLIRSLFTVFFEAVLSERDWFILPRYYQEVLQSGANHEEKLRIVADVIASMSESQAIEVNQRLTGQTLGSAMDQMLQ